MLISEEKKILRKQINERKKNIDREEKERRSIEIFSKIEQSEIFREAKVIMAYWSLDDEVHTHDFIQKWYKKKTILLPVIVGNTIIVKQFRGGQFLVSDKHYGIKEPVGGVFKDLSRIEVIIVPGLAFDRKGNRLGRGKAFYDGFLKNMHAYKIGVCFNFQLVPSVPVGEKDIAMDEVISA